MLRGGLSRQRVAMTFVVIFLVVQIAVPLAALAGPRPGRFSWQMYSGVRTQATFSIVHQDGSLTPVTPRDYVAHPRLDIDFVAWLPDHVCSVEPDAVAVQVERAHDIKDVITCSR